MNMDVATKFRMEAVGFHQCSVQELLSLTPEENELVETRLAPTSVIEQSRQEQNMAPKALAERLDFDQGKASEQN